MASSPIDWLLTSDPAIRWQAMRDLLGRPEEEWQAERRKVETEGWGAQLLAHQDPDGQWAGGAFAAKDVPWGTWKDVGQPWTATCWALGQLQEFGLDPRSEAARRTVDLVGKNSKWEEGNQPFWQGEVEECINGRTLGTGAYFGVDMAPLAARLVGERLADGAWNCERANGSKVSSFATTINVLEGLLEFEMMTGGTPETKAARKTGEEYLLKRDLFRRLSTGQPADEKFLQLVHPPQWHYDLLHALDYFRQAALIDAETAGGSGTGDDSGSAAKPDARLKEAVEILRAKQLDDGRWALERELKGKRWFAMNDGVGKPCPWLTLKAMRVLKWWDGQHA